MVNKFLIYILTSQQTKEWADKLYYASDEVASKMIEAATDYNQ